MKDKKHIDRLFQEGFKDFEVAPSDAVWQNIEAKLNQHKKRRRLIPIWWRYAGVAALLLLLLTIGAIYFNNQDTSQTNQVVDTETPTKNPTNYSDHPDVNKSTSTHDLNTENASENNELKKDVNKDSKTLSNISNPLKETSIVKTSVSKNANERSGDDGISSHKTLSASHSTLKTENAVTSRLEEKNKTFIKNLETSPEIVNSGIVSASNKKDKSALATNNSEKDESLINNDSEENTIEHAIEKTMKDEKELIPLNRWTIATHAAPVYFNSLGKGSSIDAQFIDNSKNGELTMSYGVSASYTINNKLSVRSGINKVNLGYNTNNVVVFESIGSKSSLNSLKNADINNGASANFSVISSERLDALDNTLVKTSETSINQSFGYIEIPLEIAYAIVNKKFGFHVIGGFSSFILSNNALFSEFKGSQTRIGEATNLNNVSYSANFGLGLSYQLTKKLDLNLEPLFKYQINTFNNTSGNFNPYFIGVYTGIGFKF